MRDEYDFSKAVKNPYADKTKTAITIRLDKANVDYFKQLSAKLNIPYQTLINSFLSDCVAKRLTPKTSWS
ncbi:MAG: BrnA antitoxin family protein [Duodenibacillus sp.]|nr:BrnA antitoxin family protein [Duodenibacillus sp.]